MKFVDPLVDQSVDSPSPFHWLARQSVGAPVSQSLQVRTNELLFFSSKLKETTHVMYVQFMLDLLISTFQRNY